jgi:transcriptional regulator with XRE-family HTH domain
MPPARKKPPLAPELAALGQAFEQLRREKGLTQEAVGDSDRTDHKRAGALERGQRNSQYLTLIRLAEALETPLSEIVDRAERILEQRRAGSQVESADSVQTSSTKRSHSASTSRAQP